MPQKFDRDLEALKTKLLAMGALAESMIQQAIVLLEDQKLDLIPEIRDAEHEINRFEREIDTEVVRLIGVYTPVAADLRFLLMATRINGALERVGDLVENICDHFEGLLHQNLLKPKTELSTMARLAQQMLERSLNAFVEQSDELAVEVMKTDDELDELNDQIFRDLLSQMHEQPQSISRAMGQILMARAFERIGDMAVNIAEDVSYMVHGEDVRHVKTSW